MSVVVFEGGDPILLSYVLQALEDAGVPVELQGSPAGTGLSCGGRPSPGLLLVPAQEEARARAIIARQMVEVAPEIEEVVEPPSGFRRIGHWLRGVLGGG